MFWETIDVSALLICYGPLFLTVGGFIVFAVLTDLSARRTYVRRIDMRDEIEQLEDDVPVRVDRPKTMETPSGDVVTVTPTVVSDSPTLPPPAAKPLPPADEPKVTDDPPAETPASEPDQLTRLEGIGPKVAAALIDAGLDTFTKVAAATIEDFAAALAAAGINFAPSAESWAEQASFAARGDWAGLEELQLRLVSGRYPTDDDES